MVFQQNQMQPMLSQNLRFCSLTSFKGYVSSLRSACALPNDCWTAGTVEDYMRFKVKHFFLLYLVQSAQAVLGLSIYWCKMQNVHN